LAFHQSKSGNGVARRSSLAPSQCDTFLLFAHVNIRGRQQRTTAAKYAGLFFHHIEPPRFLSFSFSSSPTIFCSSQSQQLTLSCFISSCHYPVSLSSIQIPVTCWRHRPPTLILHPRLLSRFALLSVTPILHSTHNTPSSRPRALLLTSELRPAFQLDTLTSPHLQIEACWSRLLAEHDSPDCTSLDLDHAFPHLVPGTLCPACLCARRRPCRRRSCCS
jgi:hypothetical protein